LVKTNVDYADEQITVYRSCPFECRYCYVRLPIYRARLRRGRYDPMAEARRIARLSEPKTVCVSFTSDPFPWAERKLRITMEVLRALSPAKHHRVLILTKNPMLAFDELCRLREEGLSVEHFWLGTTVVDFEGLLEPKAPHPAKRLLTLKEAKEAGFKTWLSLEPIIAHHTPLDAILGETVNYVDWYVLGKLNYASRVDLPEWMADEDWYREVVGKVFIPKLRALGVSFHVKKELREVLERGQD